jgi:phage tail-like protein
MANRLLDYLPAIYQTDSDIDLYLRAFEKVLLGRPENVGFEVQGLEEEIAAIPRYFNSIDLNPIDSRKPQETPQEFLAWLASWVALSLRADLDERSQRRFIACSVERYQFRGTKANLQQLLELFLSATPSVNDETGRVHHFQVIISFPAINSPEILGRQLDIASNVIELEKPAHTSYDLDVRFPTMRIGDPAHPNRRNSKLGIGTVLGTIPLEEPPEEEQ